MLNWSVGQTPNRLRPQPPRLCSSSALAWSLAAVIAAASPPAIAQAPDPAPETPDARGDEPLWEVGIGAAVASTPAYPASDQNQLNYLPFPTFIYRGEIFRADGEGLRARAIDDGRLTLDIGVNGAFPANSDDIDARAGMPDLDWVGEFGPKLEYRLSPSPGPQKLSVDVALRGVVVTDFTDELKYQGVTLSPSLAYEGEYASGRGGFILRISSVFGFDGYNDYFYEVAPEFQTASRPAYDAQSGYVGTNLTAASSFKLTDRIQVFGFGQVGLHSGSANRDSPLFREETNLSGGLGLSIRLFESERRARR